ncbi:hypothetical protein MLD38_039443 [Melastoma candidum]|uniref:Uncharacterized protein n=1 Tax=Melastoma candidum TaxID=119954 RepID=A0ACB9L3I2_9MYRT|nr:hypothetical protein MLD38_039443 [Melastoma candidum]
MKRDEYKKGLWTVEEDRILAEYVEVHGKGKWNRIPLATGARVSLEYAVLMIMLCREMDECCLVAAVVVGLRRSGKSSRLRWVNYLSPNVKRGDFTHEEEDLIIRLHNLLGNRWSLIAGRLPGRTDNQVKNHWNSHLRKKISSIDGPRCKNHNAGSSNNTSIASRHRPDDKRSKVGLMAVSDPKPGSDKRAEDGENNASSSRSTVADSRRGGVEANNVGPSASVWLFGDQLGLAGATNLMGCLGDFEFDFILYGR